MKTFALFPAMLVLLLAVTPQSRAATKTWDGSNNALWSSPANWTNGAAPVNGDDLIFPAGAATKANNNDLPNLSLRSLTFADSGYTLSGGVTTFIATNGINSKQASGSNAITFPTFLATNITVTIANSGTSLGVSGSVAFNAFDLTTAGNGLLDMSGFVSGSGDLIKLGTGTNRISGSVANTFSGDTLVSAGTLELRKTGSAVALPGNLITINAGATVRHFQPNQIATGADVAVGGSSSVSGNWDLNGQNATIGALTLTAGVVETGGATLTLGGDVTASAVGGITPRNSSIIGNLLLGAASRTFNVSHTILVNSDLAVSANIAGAAGIGIVKTGAGVLELSGVNTYPGQTIVSNGSITAATTTALGTSSVGTTLNGGSLLIDGLIISGELLTNNSSSSSFSAGGTTNVWIGNIVLNADLDVFVPTNTVLTLQGVISGTGGLIKNQPGLAVLSGSTVNTFSGTTTVNQGELRLSKSSGSAVVGPLVIGDGTGGVKADMVSVTSAGELGNSTTLTINGTGFLNLSNFNSFVGQISMNGGVIETGSGVLTLSGNLTATASGLSDSKIRGLLALSAGTHIFNVSDAPSFVPDCSIEAVISGGGGITKAGNGELDFQTGSTYTGTTTINEGVLRIDNNTSLGSTAAGTVVNSNGVLRLVSGPGLAVGNEPLALNGSGNGSLGTLHLTTGSNSWSGAITLGGDAHINCFTGTALTLSGTVDGNGTLTKDGVGPLTFTGNGNTYTNKTTVSSGTLVLNKSSGRSIAGPLVITAPGVVRGVAVDEISFASAVTVNAGATLDLPVGQTIGSLAGAGNVTLGAVNLAAGQSGSNTLFTGVISGPGSFTKTGTGTMTLTGTNTYAGTTALSFGTLLVNGSQPQSPVTVDFDTTLGGTGVVGHITMLGFGNVAPGQSPGSLTCSNLSFPGTVQVNKLNLELNNAIPGSGYDQLKVRGTVALTNASLNVTLGFSSAISNSFLIIDNDAGDPVAGTFNGKPEGAVFPIGSEQFRLSYVGGTGNDVVLTQVTDNHSLIQPHLTIQSLSATTVRLAWPSSFSNFYLQTNGNAATTNWGFLDQLRLIDGTNFVTTNVLTTPALFYRLITD